MANVYGGGAGPTAPTSAYTRDSNYAIKLHQFDDRQAAQQNQPVARVWNPRPVEQYQVGATPLVGTTPWDATGGRWQQFLDPSSAPQVQRSAYTAPTGGPMLLDAEDTGITLGGDYGLNQWVDSISEQLRYGQGDRIEAAREAQVARGMGRSGEAILSEDAVRRETELEIASQAASAAVQQATLEQDTMKAYGNLKTSRDLANQAAHGAWQELLEQGRQFQATLEHERQIANQQAQIQQSGQALQYAGLLSQLETERVLANQTTTRLYEEMRLNESQFTRASNLQLEIERAANQLGYAQLGEQARATDLQYGQGAGGAGSWEDVIAAYTSLRASQDAIGDPLYDNSQAYNLVQQMYPGMDWGSAANQFRIGAGLATPITLQPGAPQSATTSSEYNTTPIPHRRRVLPSYR